MSQSTLIPLLRNVAHTRKRPRSWPNMADMAKRLAICAILFAAIFLAFYIDSSRVGKARAAAEAAESKVLQQAVEEYTKDNGKPPQELEDLVDKGYLKALPRTQPELISN